MRIYPNTTVDYEFQQLGSLGHSGSLNDRQFSFLRTSGYRGALADMLAQYLNFSPLNLFTSSEPGVWLDPSDLSTLFQDAAGTTPVTAAGQSVGLVLDKSKGLVLGSELVTNGDFSNGTAGWTGRNATLSTSNGQLTVTSTSTSGRATHNFLITSGVFYEALVTVIGGTGPRGVRFGVSDGSNFYFNGAGKNTTYSLKFLATSSSLWISLYSGDVVGDTAIFDNISVRELPGNHATQSIFASRPIYQVDSGGRPYLSFDGVDDFLVTPTITPGTDKVQVFAGVRKLSDAAAGTVVESSVSTASNNGSFGLFAPVLTSGEYQYNSRGTVVASPRSGVVAAPITNVLTGLGDISSDLATLRVNGTQAAQSTADQGTGNYLAYPLYIGRRGGATLPFNGRLYGLITRFGPNLTADQISQTERWLAQRTGVTL